MKYCETCEYKCPNFDIDEDGVDNGSDIICVNKQSIYYCEEVTQFEACHLYSDEGGWF